MCRQQHGPTCPLEFHKDTLAFIINAYNCTHGPTFVQQVTKSLIPRLNLTQRGSCLQRLDCSVVKDCVVNGHSAISCASTLGHFVSEFNKRRQQQQQQQQQQQLHNIIREDMETRDILSAFLLSSVAV